MPQESSEQSISVPRTSYLLLIAFVSGMAIMGVEMSSGRLFAPYFGSSLTIWTTIITATMIALTCGYYFGGVFAERNPRLSALSKFLLAASIYIIFLPYIAQPILDSTISRLSAKGGSGILFSLVTCSVLISVPLVIFGMTSPFLIRISASKSDRVGLIAGKIFAVSTLGSIIGTLLPALVLIPSIGTRLTFFVFGAAVMIVVIWGVKGEKVALAAVVIGTLAFGAFLGFKNSVLKDNKYLVAEKETNYELVQIFKAPMTDTTSQRKTEAVMLITDAAFGVQSLWLPGKTYTDSWQDFFAVMAKTYEVSNGKEPKKILVCGLGGGCAPFVISQFYPEAQFDGVEIDGGLIEVARPYFPLNFVKNLTIHVQDARAFVRSSDTKYDLIIVDTFRPPHIPFHMGTQEFFSEAKQVLNAGGIFAMNIGTGKRFLVYDALANTAASVFKHAYYGQNPFSEDEDFINRFLIASDHDLKLSNFETEEAIFNTSDADWSRIFHTIRTKGKMPGQTAYFQQIRPNSGVILTDDKSALDRISEREFFGMIIGRK